MVLVIQKHARRTSENNMVNDCLRKKARGGDRFFETSLKKTSIKKISATNESDPIIEDLLNGVITQRRMKYG